jgi:triosephosphate isomerase
MRQGESDELVAKKVKQAIDGGMSVIACIGENVKSGCI